MNGELDLELYIISIIRLNTAFEKLENDGVNEEIKEMFSQSANDLNELYKDIIEDLNQSEIQLNEYYLFFENGKQTFPQYIEALRSLDYDELRQSAESLINVFSNFNEISKAFPVNDVIK